MFKINSFSAQASNVQFNGREPEVSKEDKSVSNQDKKESKAVNSYVALANITGKSGKPIDKETAKAEIKRLQADLKNQMATPPKSRDYRDWGYYNAYMDRIQSNIADLRKVCPLDKTNREEVLMATPQELFNPLKADNIKGKGISFCQSLPDDPEEFKNNVYTVVPMLTHARTTEDLINIGKRDGINIELVPDEKGEYFLGVKNIWENDGYFRIDRDSAVIKYGKYSADDEYVDKKWAEKNKDENNQITDCAVIANDKGLKILEKSYVHEGGAKIDENDMHKWNGYKAHKDVNAVVNAVAWDSPKTVSTLEGEIETDVTMGDVEGFAYNKFKQLKKQIVSNKLKANPDDPNSAKFIELIKDGKDDDAKALLVKATKDSEIE